MSAVGVRTANLPLAGRRVELHIIVRRFPCDTLRCGRQFYAKCFADDAIVRQLGRTAPLDSCRHYESK